MRRGAAQAPQTRGITPYDFDFVVNEDIEASDWTGCLGAAFQGRIRCKGYRHRIGQTVRWRLCGRCRLRRWECVGDVIQAVGRWDVMMEDSLVGDVRHRLRRAAKIW